MKLKIAKKFAVSVYKSSLMLNLDDLSKFELWVIVIL
jgi:hypothetical protein